MSEAGGKNPRGVSDLERRTYHRIDDEVVLQYREVQEPARTERTGEVPARFLNIFTLSAQFAAQTRELRAQLKTIEAQAPAVAAYLTALDRKLDMVAQVLLAEEVGDTGSATREVSLSAGGVAFHSDRVLLPGALLELQLVLLPAFTGLLTYGRVIYCSRESDPPDPAYPYRVAVEYEGLNEATRDLITRQVLAREAAMLRARRDALLDQEPE